MHTPRVSIVIPVYNISRFLDEAIRSALSQNYPGTEVVVVNDGSTLDTKEKIVAICAAYPQVHLIHQENQGQAMARRTGVLNARGEFIIFLDADDILMPGAIAFLVDHCVAHPDAIGVYGTKMRMEENGDFIRNSLLPTPEQVASGDVLPALLKGEPLFSHGNICLKRSVLEKVDYPSKLRQGEDWVTWCRIALFGDIAYVGDRVCLALRAHTQNVSSEVFKDPSKLFKMFGYVYDDPAIIAAVGQEKLEEYRVQHLKRIHTYLRYCYLDRKHYFRAYIQKRHLRALPRSPNQKIRVLHVVKWFYAGGAERLLSAVLEHSDRDRFEHIVLSLSEQNERIREVQHTLNIPYRSFEIPPGFGHFRQYRQCMDFIREQRPDVIKSWLPPGNIAGGIMGKLLRIPVIWGIHIAPPPEKQPRDVKLQTRLSHFIPKAIVCCSKTAYDNCVQVGCNPRLLTLITNGTDTQRFQHSKEGRKRIRQELGIGDDTILIGMAAECTPVKRHQHFLIAAKLLTVSQPNVRFLFCGKHTSPENTALMEFITFLDMHGLVHLLGIRDDMPDIYSALDIHTLNSSRESFGLAITESMACETLSVASDVAQLKDILKDVGFVVPPVDDPNPLVTAWKQAMALPEREKRKRLQTGRQRIVTEYSITQTAKAYDNLYLRIMGRKT